MPNQFPANDQQETLRSAVMTNFRQGFWHVLDSTSYWSSCLHHDAIHYKSIATIDVYIYRLYHIVYYTFISGLIRNSKSPLFEKSEKTLALFTLQETRKHIPPFTGSSENHRLKKCQTVKRICVSSLEGR